MTEVTAGRVETEEHAGLRGRARAMGASIHLRPDRGALWLVGLCGAIVIALFLALGFGHFSRTESVRGYVSASSGMTRLNAQTSGVVQGINVRQGDLVKAGQSLLVLAPRDVSSNGISTTEAALASLRQRRTNLTEDRKRAALFLDTVGNDKTQLTSTMDNVIKEMDKQEKNVSEAYTRQQEMVKKARDYMDQGYATRDAVSAQERVSFEYSRQLSDIRIKKAELRQQTTDRTRTQQTTVLEKQAQISSIDSELASIDSQLAQTQALTRLDVVAPIGGQVTGILVEKGATVSAEQTLVAIADPKAEPMIVLEVPSRAIGMTKVGQRVVLKYDAFPFKTFGVAYGSVNSISSTPIKDPTVTAPQDGMSDPRPAAAATGGRQSVFRVEVKPEQRFISAYGHNEPIAMGSTLTSDIIVERRRLINWILDPIRAMRGRA